MDITSQLTDIPVESNRPPAFVLEGTLRSHSTKNLAHHACHQIMKIRTGITLLVEKDRQQPLFSNMTAFIPAGLPHRSTPLGEAVYYKSIYLDEAMFRRNISDIVIFDMSDLGAALFDRISSLMAPQGADPEDLDGQCLKLLLKLMETEIHHRSHLARIPVPRNPANLRITAFIASRFQSKLTLSDFTNALHYSERHLSRVFKEDIGITIFEYLRLYRIFQASLKLLRKGASKTITEIALSCGYDSLSSFYKDFKEIFVMTPRAFSQKNGETHS
jgi:AraC-like DNA-binding protein